MKWFPNAQEACDELQRESALPALQSQFDTLPEKPKRSNHARLSATFADTRPWTFISSQASDRSSSSSRKRRSLFGNRSSTTSSPGPNPEPHQSGDPFSNETSEQQQQQQQHASARRESGLGGPRPVSTIDSAASNPRTSVSGLESWRSSIFSRKRSSRINEIDEPVMEPRLARYGRKISSTRPSMDFWNRESDSEEACESAQVSSPTRGKPALTDKVYKGLKKSSISTPFNFQHVTHTQRDHLPEIDSVTDRELMSEFWAASAYQAPRRQLRGIPVQTIERESCEPSASSQRSQDEPLNESFQFRRGPLAGLSSTLGDKDSAPGTPGTPSDSESITPVCESRPSLSLNGLSSAERLAIIGVEQRDPPAMVHPAFRSQTAAPADYRPHINGPVYELPATSLDSVPEEIEASSPPRSREGRLRTESSPYLLTKASAQQPSSIAALAKAPTFMPFPVGNAFAQAYGGTGADLMPCNDRISFSCEDSVASLTSGETWENEVDLLYLVEAESTCDFDWTSLKSSRKGSDSSPHRRDSDAASSLRANSVRDDASTRPSSQRTSVKSYHDEGLFSGFDGTSLCNTSLTQNFGIPNRRHSAVSTSNAELTPILEVGREVAISREDSGFATFVASLSPKHGRSASYSGQRPEPPKRPARWSIASPLYLPEDAKRRKPSFTTQLVAPSPEQLPFSAPLFPPPALPLPEIPKSRPTGLISPPISPPTLCSPEFSTLRRPTSSQDRALLQAAGRIVQRGRSGRPATPSRLSHVQNVKDTSPQTFGQQAYSTPKMDSVHFSMALFPTPPSSPPRHQGEEAYPAWI